jgi:uncharacterized protein
MVEVGKFNKLKIVKKNNKGLFLDGEEIGEIFLPLKEAPRESIIGGELEVFIYLGANDKITATTKRPFATVGQFAYLKVISVNNVGAFLDWGLGKDLLVPFRNQMQPMKEERSYVVYVYFDKVSKRIAASSKLMKYINLEPLNYKEGQKVDLIIANDTNLGFKAIINRVHWGILYKNEVFKELRKGDEIPGFIKKIRDDGKIDLSLNKAGPKKIDNLRKIILEVLKKEGGFLPVNDKSSPKLIHEFFGESKSTFKNAIGALYKKQLIDIEKNGIRLRDKDL